MPLTLAPDEGAMMQEFTAVNRRRRKFNTLSAAGRVEELLEALEEVEDPAEAVRLARTVRDNLVVFKHDAPLARMQLALGELPGGAVDTSHTRVSKVAAGGTKATLQVVVRRAKDLPIKDATTGSSDPFVTVEVLEATEHGGMRGVASARTEVKVMTLNPEWQQTFLLPLSSSSPVFRASVYDWDMDGSDDFIGQVNPKPPRYPQMADYW